MKKQNNTRIIVIILAFILISSLILLLTKSPGGSDLSALSISYISEQSDLEFLDFCSSELECQTFLLSQGMPDNFLQLKGYEIICQNGICNAQKI